jgi:hypothetical protein
VAEFDELDRLAPLAAGDPLDAEAAVERGTENVTRSATNACIGREG